MKETKSGSGYLNDSTLSCTFSVLHWMVRIESLTSLHIKLNGGSFGIAEPEFFYLPDS
jgi:hypothetical protein